MQPPLLILPLHARDLHLTKRNSIDLRFFSITAASELSRFSPSSSSRKVVSCDFVVKFAQLNATAADLLFLNFFSPTAKEATFLEACLENHTKSNLYMDQVEFEPTQHWSASVLKTDDYYISKSNTQTSKLFRPPLLIRAGGGIFNFLYQLKQSSQESTQVKVGGSNILGKLQITWRTTLGEPGRLQTQQIVGTPLVQKDIDLQVVEVPSAIILERPFLVRLKLTNQSERAAGPFEVTVSQGSSSSPKVVMVNGIQKLVLQPLEALDSTDFSLNMIATRLGVQKISGITIFDTREKRMYDPLPDVEIFVDSE